MLNVEFTDRYGGYPPSWLRTCHGDCEAMGWVPIQLQADAEHPDGWRFMPCRACGGTGRVSWLVSLGRVPRWLWKGIRFMRWALPAEANPPEWGFLKRLRVALWCTYGADLGALFR